MIWAICHHPSLQLNLNRPRPRSPQRAQIGRATLKRHTHKGRRHAHHGGSFRDGRTRRNNQKSLCQIHHLVTPRYPAQAAYQARACSLATAPTKNYPLNCLRATSTSPGPLPSAEGPNPRDGRRSGKHQREANQRDPAFSLRMLFHSPFPWPNVSRPAIRSHQNQQQNTRPVHILPICPKVPLLQHDVKYYFLVRPKRPV